MYLWVGRGLLVVESDFYVQLDIQAEQKVGLSVGFDHWLFALKVEKNGIACCLKVKPNPFR